MQSLVSLLFLVMAAISLIAQEGSAIETDYSPLTKSERAKQKSHAIAAKTVSPVTFSITYLENSDDQQLFTIAVNGKTGWREIKDYTPYYYRNWIVDLDTNGLDDLVLDVSPGSQGLGLGCSIYLFLQHRDGSFTKLVLPAERFELNDIVDLDADKTFEIITCRLIRYEDHTYWTYHCWYIQEYEIGNVDKEYGFPRAVQYKFKPNTKQVDVKTIAGILKVEKNQEGTSESAVE